MNSPEIIAFPNILVMKVGFHADEGIEAIIDRKQKEQEMLGYALWGYGGTLCHPVRSVQPYSDIAVANGGEVRVVFIATPSPFVSEPIEAKELSKDGIIWETLPLNSKVTASKYALMLKDIEKYEAILPLDAYGVAYGPSAGKVLSDYLRFRVDKAVAQRLTGIGSVANKVVKVGFTAKLTYPYAVFVR